MQKSRENFLIAGIICLTAGAFFSVAGIISLAGTVGLSGIVLFLLGMTIKSDQGMSPEEI
jgi:membrane-bound ClpP family serine protease